MFAWLFDKRFDCFILQWSVDEFHNFFSIISQIGDFFMRSIDEIRYFFLLTFDKIRDFSWRSFEVICNFSATDLFVTYFFLIGYWNLCFFLYRLIGKIWFFLYIYNWIIDFPKCCKKIKLFLEVCLIRKIITCLWENLRCGGMAYSIFPARYFKPSNVDISSWEVK